MKLIQSFNDWGHMYEAERNLESFLDSVYESALNENIGAILGSPIKYMKLKKAAKEYQTSLVQKAVNNLDFEKKKAAGNLDPKQKEVLIAANKQKNQALSDKASAISQKMDSLATTAGLKTVSSIAKNKSQIAAAEIAAKTADGEEAKSLKLKIQGLNKKVAASQEELEDYKDKAEDEPNIDNVKTDDGSTIKDKKDAVDKEAADKEAADKKAKEDKEKENKNKAVEAARTKVTEAEAAESALPADATPEQKAEAKKKVATAKLGLAQAEKAALPADATPEQKTAADEKIATAQAALTGGGGGAQAVEAARTKVTEAKAAESALGDDATPEQKAEAKKKVATAELNLAKAEKAALPADATDEQKATADEKIAAAQAALTALNDSYSLNMTGSRHISESIATRFKRAMDQRGPIY
jgi:hypothetical protein